MKIISTMSALSLDQQVFFREQLNRLGKNEGIISICLDNHSVFIEYNPYVLKKDLVMKFLLDIKFPFNEKTIESPIDVLVA